jgi:DNA modification methylase
MNKILLGDCREALKQLDAGSVQTCVTSPPYYGLRDYGTAKWEGGDQDCDHSPEQRGGRFATPVSAKQVSNTGSGTASARNCSCGAVRVDSQIGLEETPDAYVENLVSVFREVRRVLADDGTLWLNLGDSYAGSGVNDGSKNPGLSKAAQRGDAKRRPSHLEGIKPKDLIGIPWMVAFALRADGWYLRQDIIWAKPNPMPESVTDRCTKSHEYIFLLSKSAQYYYDNEAIMEPLAAASISRLSQDVENQTGSTRANGGAKSNGNMKAVYKNLQPDGQQPNSFHLSRAEGKPDEVYTSRNKRDVWTVTTKPYSGAHFATFPPDLIEPCILAGSRVGDTVLDPFGGSGTTAAVSVKHHRNYVICELNPAYIELAEKRLSGVQPVLFGATS